MARYTIIFASLCILLLGLAACQNGATPTLAPVANVASPESVATLPEVSATLISTAVVPTATAVPPTPTPTPPLAAMINNEPLLLSAYEKELARWEQAQSPNQTPDANYRQEALNGLIEKILITQAATEQGIVIDPAAVDTELATLRQNTGEANFAAWLEANQWTEEEFRQELTNAMIIEQMVALVTKDVPYKTEQVHARYIQLDDAAQAETLLTQLRNGDDFALRAQQYSLDNRTAQLGGDLGFFAHGFLLVPEVEEAAFALQPGEISEVVTVTNADGRTTYYLVQTLERQEERPLTPDFRSVLLDQTFHTWLDQLWQTATIVRFVEG